MRASPVIVMGRAKREESEVKSLNVAWRSEDAEQSKLVSWVFLSQQSCGKEGR